MRIYLSAVLLGLALPFSAFAIESRLILKTSYNFDRIYFGSKNQLVVGGQTGSQLYSFNYLTGEKTDLSCADHSDHERTVLNRDVSLDGKWSIYGIWQQPQVRVENLKTRECFDLNLGLEPQETVQLFVMLPASNAAVIQVLEAKGETWRLMLYDFEKKSLATIEQAWSRDASWELSSDERTISIHSNGGPKPQAWSYSVEMQRLIEMKIPYDSKVRIKRAYPSVWGRVILIGTSPDGAEVMAEFDNWSGRPISSWKRMTNWSGSFHPSSPIEEDFFHWVGHTADSRVLIDTVHQTMIPIGRWGSDIIPVRSDSDRYGALFLTSYGGDGSGQLAYKLAQHTWGETGVSLVRDPKGYPFLFRQNAPAPMLKLLPLRNRIMAIGAYYDYSHGPRGVTVLEGPAADPSQLQVVGQLPSSPVLLHFINPNGDFVYRDWSGDVHLVRHSPYVLGPTVKDSKGKFEQMSQPEAFNYCRKVGGYLPTIRELVMALHPSGISEAPRAGAELIEPRFAAPFYFDRQGYQSSTETTDVRDDWWSDSLTAGFSDPVYYSFRCMEGYINGGNLPEYASFHHVRCMMPSDGQGI